MTGRAVHGFGALRRRPIEPTSHRYRPERTDLAFAAGLVFGSLILGAAIGFGGVSGWAVVGAAGGAALCLIFRELGLYVLLAWAVLEGVAYPFLRFPPGTTLVTFDRIWLGAVLGAMLVTAPRIHRSSATRLLTGALAWLVLAYGVRALFTSGPDQGQLKAVATWVDAILLPAGLFLATRKLADTPLGIRRLMGALAIGGVVVALVGLASRALGFDLAPLSGAVPRFDKNIGQVRISGPYNVPEVFGLVLLMTLAATVYWIQVGRRRLPLVALIAITLQLAAIGLTYFRAAWIGALIVVVAGFGLRPKRHARLLGTLGVVGALVLSAFVLTESSGGALSTRLRNEDTVQSRFATYLDGARIFERYPLFGAGVQQFDRAHAALPVSTTVGGFASAEHPHSSYVGVMAEQGLWGFLPLLLLTFVILRVLRSLTRAARSREDVILGACAVGVGLAYLIMSLTLTMLPYGPSNAFFLVWLAVATARLDALRAAHDGSPRNPNGQA